MFMPVIYFYIFLKYNLKVDVDINIYYLKSRLFFIPIDFEEYTMENILIIKHPLIRTIILLGIFPLNICLEVEFNSRFAPHQGMITKYEQPQRGA